jgi:hypothetical protein
MYGTPPKYKIGGIKLTPNPVKALGIFFGHNKEECKKLKWEKKIQEMKNQLPKYFYFIHG